MALEHLRLEDYSDRELLLVLVDVADSAGWADPRDVADRLGMGGDHPHRMVASRLAWLKRYGAVMMEPDDEHAQRPRDSDGKRPTARRWGLTTIGNALAQGTMRKATETALERVGDDQMLVLTRWLARRPSNAVVANLARREWQRETLLRGR
jgi:hypothetical protein